ncbi:F-box protein CPR1 [Linum grandiflorum]
MAGDENVDADPHPTAAYLTEDILINILLRLPVASCIARFRCVCKSWRHLLSDPKFIRKILFFRNSDDEKSLPGHDRPHSFETLRPIPGYNQPSDLVPPVSGRVTDIIGICGGIVCMAYIDCNARYGEAPCNIILWNPATSEAKILPPCPVHPVGTPWHRPLVVGNEYTGFGFDPLTKDYKVIRALHFHPVDLTWENRDIEYHFEPSQIYIGDGPWTPFFIEVYSLKNDSWKRLNAEHHKIGDLLTYCPKPVQQYTSRNEKCYWFRDANPYDGYKYYPVFDIISFDMSDEVFELVTVTRPAAVIEQQVNGGDLPAAVYRDIWSASSCYMLKGVFVVTWSRCRHNEIWGLLKHGVAESWTKLLSFPRSIPYLDELQVYWKDEMQIAESVVGRVFLYDPATGKLNLEMERSS